MRGSGRLWVGAIGVFLLAGGYLFGATYGGGSGTEANPYQIWTAEQMYAIGYNDADWDKHFVLMADIDMAEVAGIHYKCIGYVSWPNAVAWPVHQPFRGTFDGKGHIIRNLTIDAPNTCFGLFAYVEDAVIQNVRLENVLISYSQFVYAPYGGYGVGALIGAQYGGLVENCYADGVIYASGVSGDKYIGGLIGAQVEGTISGCSNHVEIHVLGETNRVGGLVGNSASGTIIDCFSTGDIYGRGYVGGLLGKQSGEAAVLQRCYSTGRIYGGGAIGGLLGIQEEPLGTVAACFWDRQSSGLEVSAGGAGAAGLTTEAMMNLSTFTAAGWDFADETVNGSSDTWRLCDAGRGYPRLSGHIEPKGDLACPDGVGLEDAAMLAAHWLTEAEGNSEFSAACDMNLDGRVEYADWSFLSRNWGMPRFSEISLSKDICLFYTRPDGPAAAPQKLTIENQGGGVLAWSIEADEPLPGWLAIAPSGGSLLPGERAPLTLTAEHAELASGGYRYAFRVVDPNAVNAPLAVTVTLWNGDSLEAHWSFDETTGVTAFDGSGNGRDGALMNVSESGSWVPGLVGGALWLSGPPAYGAYSDYMRVDDSAGLDFGPEDNFTISGWFKTTCQDDCRLVYNVGAGPNGYALFLNRGEISFRTWSTADPISVRRLVSTSDGYSDGQWHHVAGVRRAGESLRIYIDGLLRGQTPVDGGRDLANEVPLTLGADTYSSPTGTFFYQGLLDEWQVYSRSLSPEEIEVIAGH